jgi:hypothetical protein
MCSWSAFLVESKGKGRVEEGPHSFNGTDINSIKPPEQSVMRQAAMSTRLPGSFTDGLETVDGPESLVAVHDLGNYYDLDPSCLIK